MVDNFDADIHSPNGKLPNHSLAMILTQSSSPGNDPDDDTIERLKHSDVKHPIDEHEDVAGSKVFVYTGFICHPTWMQMVTLFPCFLLVRR